MLESPAMLYQRLGRQLRRLLKDQLLKDRGCDNEETYALTAARSDEEVGRLVLQRDENAVFQISSASELDRMLVCDIDTLSAHNADTKAYATPHAATRLKVGAALLKTVMKVNYDIELEFFSSGNQGLHVFAFGTSFTKQACACMADLLPSPASFEQCKQVFEASAYSEDKLSEVVECCLQMLGELEWEPYKTDPESERVLRAMRPGASWFEKLYGVTAFFDCNVTKNGIIRGPCGYNAKATGFVGFPLPNPISDQPWPEIRRPVEASTPPHSGVAPCCMSEAEFALLEQMVVNSPSASRHAEMLIVQSAQTQRPQARARDMSYSPSWCFQTDHRVRLQPLMIPNAKPDEDQDPVLLLYFDGTCT